MARGMCLDSFESGTTELRGKALTYEAVKARVLEAGRFSVFEATFTRRHAAIFDRLRRDPAVTCTSIGFPWIAVARKETA